MATSPAAPNDEPAPWRPDDYIIRGRFCDTPSVSAALEELRTAATATAALLLVHRGRTLFQSLLLLAHSDPVVRATTQYALSAEPFVEVPRGPDPFALDPAVPNARRRLRTLVRKRPLRAAEGLFEMPFRLIARPATPRPASAAGVSVVLFDAASTGALSVIDLLDRLHLMVNATTSVVIHRGIDPRKDLDAVLADSATAGASHELIFLDAALRITQSTVGNIYLATRDRNTLTLAAQRNDRNPVNELDIARGSGVLQHSSVVAYVYDRRRPLLINDIGDFRAMHRTHYLSVTSGTDAYAELAVPIIHYAAKSGRSFGLGVINVEKLDHSEGYYTDTDLQLLRLLAERYCVMRSQQLVSESARTFDQATRRSARPLSSRSLSGAANGRKTDVPSDFSPAKPAVDDIIKSLYSLTRGHSVTVRLLTPDCQRLLRFAAYPLARMDDRHWRIRIMNTDSINAHVARTGHESYVPDFKDPIWRRRAQLPLSIQARENTRSEFCLPITVDGRLVGTLNLEGQHPDSFIETRDIARAVAQQVALALARARRAGEQVVLSMTSTSTANVHELSKLARHLRQAHRGVPGIATTSDQIRQCLRQGATRQANRGVTLDRMVATACREFRWTSSVDWRRSPDRFRLVIAGRAVGAVRYAIEELLRNALEHQITSRETFGVVLEMRTHSLASRSYVAVDIHNPIDGSVPSDTLRLLYRAPIPDGKDLHIGAFTAAAGMRALGGDIYVSASSAPQFIATLDLPPSVCRIRSSR